MSFICSNCNVPRYCSQNFHHHLKHLKSCHELYGSMNITCNIDSCPCIFKRVATWKRHIKKDHRVFHDRHLARNRSNNSQVLEDSMEVDEQVDIQEQIEINVEDDSYFCDTDNIEHDNDTESNFDNSDESYEDLVAEFLLEMREEYKCTGVGCSFVATRITDFINLALNRKKNDILKKLNEIGIDNQSLVETIKEDEVELTEAFQRFSKMKNLDNFIASKQYFNDPIEDILGYDIITNKKDSCIYVPILKTLEIICSKDDVLAHVMGTTSDDVISSFKDGSLFRDSDFFMKNPTALQVNLYCDEFVPVNKLGNKTRKHKVTGVYFTLGNIPRKNRSRLKDINLVMLFKSKHISTYGYDRLLHKLIQDLKLLETNGIHVDNNGVNIHLLGTVTMVIADNLGAHGVGGFFESFGPNVDKVCRYCTGTRDVMKTSFSCDNFDLRTIESHEEQLQLIDLSPGYSSAYGVKCRSALNSLNYYHVIQQLPFDIYHDIFEGFAVDVVSTFLQDFICVKKFFSLVDLNQCIESFPYAAYEKADLPQQLYKTNSWASFKVKQNAIEMCNLIRLLPLIIGHKVPDNDAEWLLFISFVSLVEYMLSPKFSRGKAKYLSEMIEEFLQSFFEIFPAVSVKPKAHFLIHYPQQILACGPPVDHGTIRFEGKHHYFTSIYDRSNNRKNITKTMAKRHQYMMYLHYKKKMVLDYEKPSVKCSRVVSVNNLNEFIVRQVQSVTNAPRITFFEGITFEGCVYRTGNAVAVQFDEEDLIFGKVLCMFLHHELLYMIYVLLEIDFDPHFNAFEVLNSNNYGIICSMNLVDQHPLGIYEKNNKHYMTLRHKIFK